MGQGVGARRLGVVIVTYNSAGFLPALLETLPAALEGVEADVVVVDNDSSDDTRALATRESVRVIHTHNGGYAHGINVGMANTPDSEAWLVLNPDLRLAPGCARSLLTRLRGDVGIVGPHVVDDAGALVPSMRREPTLLRALGLSRRAEWSEYVDDPRQYHREQAVDWLLGAVLMVSRECALDVGPWDESFFLYSEETDYCLRARARGWRTVYVPTAQGQHTGGGSGRSGHTHSMQILNRVRLYARRHSPAAATAYYLVALASEASWVLRGHDPSRTSIRALACPSARPQELHLGRRLIPR